MYLAHYTRPRTRTYTNRVVIRRATGLITQVLGPSSLRAGFPLTRGGAGGHLSIYSRPKINSNWIDMQRPTNRLISWVLCWAGLNAICCSWDETVPGISYCGVKDIGVRSSFLSPRRRVETRKLEVVLTYGSHIEFYLVLTI